MHGVSTGQLVKRPWARWWRPLLLVGLFGLLAAAGVLIRAKSRDASESFITAVVTRGDLEEVVAATGKIQPRAYVDVGAQASGQLNRLLVRTGDHVKEGDLLAEIDPQVQAAKVDADEAQLAQLNANLVEQQAVVEFANATLDRYSQLIAGNSVSKLSVDESRRDVKTAAAKAEAIAAQIRQMQSTLKADRVALGYTRIFAPMAGTVVSIEAREGQTLNAAYSTPQIMRIADLATMTVWTQVSEADVTRLRDGMQIYFTTLGHGDRRWTGTLRQILPSPQKPDRPPGQSDQSASPSAATNNVVLYTALFDVDNASGDLRPEMTAQVSFITGFVKNAVIAPVVALRAAPGENTATVTVLDSEGRETVRTVKTGLRTRFEAEIVSGLTPGDRLVTGKKPDSKSSLISFHL